MHIKSIYILVSSIKQIQAHRQKYSLKVSQTLLIYFVISLVCLSCLSQLPTDEIADELLSDGNGPQVVYQPLAEPIPIVPMPNDMVLRYDPDTSTQYRMNVSLQDRTQALRAARIQLNQLDGFGPFTPISVSFEGPIDLNTVNDSSVLVVNIDPQSKFFGQQVKLNLQEEIMPLNTPLGWFYGLIPEILPSSLLFDAVQGSIAPELIETQVPSLTTYYEYQSKSLILRPLIPLEHASEYAVILTNQLAGWQTEERLSMSYGHIRAPFPSKVAVSQWEAVDQVLPAINLNWSNIAYAWTFHTADLNTQFKNIRDGLYGEGPLSTLHHITPAELSEVRSSDIEHDAPDRIRDHILTLEAAFFSQLTSLVGTVLQNDGYAIEFPDVDYFVVGSFPSPQLRVNDLDHPWLIQNQTLNQTPEIKEIPFFLSVPKVSPAATPPFPVVLYFHGTNSSRFEGLILSQELAKQGIALISFDQVGHGPMIANIKDLKKTYGDVGPIIDAIPRILAQIFAPERQQEINQLSFEDGLDALSDLGLYRELAVIGRWEDLNQNQRQDNAEGFFHANPQQLCASFWQDLVDAMQLIRIIRNFDSLRIPPRVNRPKDASMERLQIHALAGDFNADGILDIGGPHVQISTGGTSLGGIHAILMSAIEPEIEVSTPIAAGGGLVDILMRSGLRFIARPLFLEFLGQVVVGCPSHEEEEEQRLYISLNDDANRCSTRDLERSAIKILPGNWEGARISIINHRTQEQNTTIVDQRNSFTIQVATDKKDELTLSITPVCDESTTSCERIDIEIEATLHGRGHKPYDADFRRATHLLQNIFDHCDPINFARQLSEDTTFDSHRVKTLMLNAIGDTSVPISTAVHLANTLGIIAPSMPQAIQAIKQLKSYHALHGIPYQNGTYYDIDDIFSDNPTEQFAVGPFYDRPVLDGLSGIRFADVEGTHEWIAGYQRDGFNYGRFSLQQVAAYHRCSGRWILDYERDCKSDPECPFLDRLYLHPMCQQNP